MNITWSSEAREQFLSSLEGTATALRLFLEQKRFFLIPEIILQWLEDLFLYATGSIPHHGILMICRDLHIPLTETEQHLLREMERVSRKEEAYRSFIDKFQDSTLFAHLIDKIEHTQHTLTHQ